MHFNQVIMKHIVVLLFSIVLVSCYQAGKQSVSPAPGETPVRKKLALRVVEIIKGSSSRVQHIRLTARCRTAVVIVAGNYKKEESLAACLPCNYVFPVLIE